MLDKMLPSAVKIWIFQCDPKKYRIRNALADKEVIKGFHWRVKKYEKEITKGYIGLMWCCGKSAGIYAITELISDPGEFIESEVDKKYWIDSTEEEGAKFRVKMKLIKSLIENPVTKETIKRNGFQELSILSMPRGTNFRVTIEEWITLKQLIEKGCVLK